ncbi:uncharacterized protein V6R79_003294 [Siganus canaliculatus]
MSVFLWLLWTLSHDTLGVPLQHAGWSSRSTHDEAQRLAFHHLPMFIHASQPLAAPELFRPVPHKSPLPAGLSGLLLPPKGQQQQVPETGSSGVAVRCGVDNISVRVDRFLTRAWPLSYLFRLGSCGPSRVSHHFLYFHYALTECGGKAQIADGLLMYTFVLHYMPPPQGSIIRVVPLQLPIHCRYDRFHYSYQVGFRPQIQHRTFMKSISAKKSFSLTVCNAQWEPLPAGHWFLLGDPVYFVVQAGVLLAGERLYVDGCYASSSTDPNSMPKVDIITNYGCMTDGRREGSRSQFLFRANNVLKFSMDSFLFTAASQVLYLHCSVSIGLTPSRTSKSCNFNQAADRWEELEAPPSICSCCDSTCSDSPDSVKSTVSSPGWFIKRKDEEKPRPRTLSFQAEDASSWVDPDREEERRFPPETRAGEGEGEAMPDKSTAPPTDKNKKHLPNASVGPRGERGPGEDEIQEVVLEKDGQAQDRYEPNETTQTRTGASFHNNPVAHLSGETSLEGCASGNTSFSKRGFGLDSRNTSPPGSIETRSTGLDGKLCLNSGERGLSATNGPIQTEKGRPSSKHSTTTATITEELFSTQKTTDPTTARLASVGESRIPNSVLVGHQSAARNFETDPLSLPVGPKAGQSRQKLDTLDKLLWPKPAPTLKSEYTSPNRTARPPGHSVGPAVIRASGAEDDEPLHQSNRTLTGAAQGFSGLITGPRSVSSGSVTSQQIHQNGPRHSPVETVANVLRGPKGSTWPDTRVAVATGWGRQVLGFVLEQPVFLEEQLSPEEFS